jgi:hypothetical protein
MGEDFGSEFAVKLLSIKLTEKGKKWTELTSRAMTVRIDSTVSQMWLPLDMCRLFEDALSLEWDDTRQFYFVNETLHNSLMEREITINITVGQNPHQINIDFPYAMFDLKMGPPYVESTSRYFPLRRANTSAEYILGRAFLQRAYLSADYDRKVFNLSRAVYDPKAANLIINIPPRSDAEKEGKKDINGSKRNTAHLGAASIAAITIGISSILIALGVFFFRHLQRKIHKPEGNEISEIDVKSRGTDSLDPNFIKAEMDGEGKPRPELDGWKNEKLELEGHVAAFELEGSTPAELPGFVPIHELREGRRYSYQEDIDTSYEKKI